MLRDWTCSDRVNELTVYSERFFTRLIMKVDDYGCFYADTRLLKANLFPLLSDTVREADLLRWMAECQKAGLIVLYESLGKKYVQIIDFKQRLDRAKSKFPLPSAIEQMQVVNDYPPERETETEQKPKEEPPAIFKSIVPVVVFFTIEHCLTVAMNDERWVRVNKTSERELQEFNSLLEKRGVYDKNPMDYKTHFANWKNSGKKSESLNGISKSDALKKKHEYT